MKRQQPLWCGITMHADTRYGKPCDELAGAYADWLGTVGIMSVPLLNGLPDYLPYLRSLPIGGIVFSGGNDLSLAAGLDPAVMRNPSPLRDDSECRLVTVALRLGLPILGICRGLQFLNAVMGGRLRTELTVSGKGATLPHAGSRHLLKIVDRDWAAAAGKAKIMTNSYHRCGIRENDLASGLHMAAVTRDGVIEAYYHPRLPLWAVQWHPERQGSCRKLDIWLLRRFANAVSRYRRDAGRTEKNADRT